MPPKVKFTREEIIAAALEMARENGIHSITARAVGKKLGVSARPIFTAFQNMEELEREVVGASKNLYNQYVQEGLQQALGFKGVGTQYIRFATEEPKLFQFLFMSEQSVVPDIAGVLSIIDQNSKQILVSVEQQYGLNESDAQRLYQHLWIYTHGIATLCATRMCKFSGEEISKMITEVFIGQLKEIKAGKNDD